MYNAVPMCRSVRDHWIYKADWFLVWFEMIATAKYTDGIKKDSLSGIIYTLEKGQFIFGGPSWSKRLGIGEQKLRTLIKKLISEDMITIIKKYPKFTIYEIRNYSKFNNQNNNLISLDSQSFQGNDNNQTNNQLTSSKQASNNIQEGKESNKKIKNIYTDDFEEFYSIYPNKFNKEQTFKNWKSTLKNDSKENIIKATMNYIKHLKIKGTTDKTYITKSTNFLGQKQEYRGYIDYEINTKLNLQNNQYEGYKISGLQENVVRI